MSKINKVALLSSLFFLSLLFPVQSQGLEKTQSGCAVPASFGEQMLERTSSISYPLIDITSPQTSYNGTFMVMVDEAGVARLILQCFNSSQYPRPGGQFKPSSGSWLEQTKFLKWGKGWTNLSLEEAKRLWGNPISQHSHFSTFDARSRDGGESNLFHLDLDFNNNGFLKAYRVRGIGISKIQWIDEQNYLSIPAKPIVP